jgi:hypothetical protein
MAAQKSANDNNGVDRTVPPPADPPFNDKIDVAYKDAKADYPAPLTAPEGAR